MWLHSYIPVCTTRYHVTGLQMKSIVLKIIFIHHILQLHYNQTKLRQQATRTQLASTTSIAQDNRTQAMQRKPLKSYKTCLVLCSTHASMLHSTVIHAGTSAAILGTWSGT